MKPIEILNSKLDFIKGVALYSTNPQKGNDNVMAVLNAYNTIDPTVQVLSECATCNEIYKDSFKIILAYLENENKSKTKK